MWKTYQLKDENTLSYFRNNIINKNSDYHALHTGRVLLVGSHSLRKNLTTDEFERGSKALFLSENTVSILYTALTD